MGTGVKIPSDASSPFRLASILPNSSPQYFKDLWSNLPCCYAKLHIVGIKSFAWCCWYSPWPRLYSGTRSSINMVLREDRKVWKSTRVTQCSDEVLTRHILLYAIAELVFLASYLFSFWIADSKDRDEELITSHSLKPPVSAFPHLESLVTAQLELKGVKVLLCRRPLMSAKAVRSTCPNYQSLPRETLWGYVDIEIYILQSPQRQKKPIPPSAVRCQYQLRQAHIHKLAAAGSNSGILNVRLP